MFFFLFWHFWKFFKVSKLFVLMKLTELILKCIFDLRRYRIFSFFKQFLVSCMYFLQVNTVFVLFLFKVLVELLKHGPTKDLLFILLSYCYVKLSSLKSYTCLCFDFFLWVLRPKFIFIHPQIKTSTFRCLCDVEKSQSMSVISYLRGGLWEWCRLCRVKRIWFRPVTQT